MENKIINPPEITCIIQDLDGKEMRLKGRRLTRKNMADYGAMMAETAKKDIEEQVAFQAAWIFEKAIEEFDNFDIRVVKKAVSLYVEEIKNPV